MFFNFSESHPSFSYQIGERPDWFRVDDNGSVLVKQVSIPMEFPDSFKNNEIGKFMIQFELANEENTTLQIARPVVFRYRSSISRIAWNILFLLPLALGIHEEKQVIQVDLMTNKDYRQFVQFNQKLQAATVMRLSISSQQVDMYASSIHFYGDVTGWAYYLYQYRFFIVSIILGLVFLIDLFIIMTVCFVFCMTGNKTKETIVEESDSTPRSIPPSPIKSESSKTLKKRKKTKVLTLDE